MLTNFSKALGDIREIREKRMQSLGPGQEKQSPGTMFGGGGLFGGGGGGNQNNQQNQQNQMQNQTGMQNRQGNQQQYNQGGGMNQMGGGMNQGNQQNQMNSGMNQGGGMMNQGSGFNNQGGMMNSQQPNMQGSAPTTSQPGGSQLVVVQQPSHQQPQVVQLVTSSGHPAGHLPSVTPAPFLSAPTPQPLVVSSVPLSSSSTNYTFDPAGLTPAQQLAYAQAQQQHQQQHLKKMRQRLPHGGKSGGSPHISRKYEGPQIGQTHLPSAALLHEAKLVGTPDTLSESGSVKSGRSRRAMNNSRTLPFLPPEEPAPLPTQAKSKQGGDRMKAFANFRQSSLDGITSRGYGGLGRPRPSNSETNLRKLALEDGRGGSRPVSALGLLQGAVAASSVVSSHGPSAAAKEHEKRILESILPPDLRHLIRGGAGGANFQSIQQIESSLRNHNKTEPSDAEIARLNAEKRLFGTQRERIVAEMQRYATMKDPRLRAEMKHKTNPVLDAQLNRQRTRQRGHRRNLSDGRISSATEHLGEDIGAYSSLPGRPYSSMSGGYTGGPDPLSSDPLGLDNSQSYLGAGDGGMSGSYLRDTAISGYGTDGTDDSNRARFLASRSRLLHRRASAGGLEGHASSVPMGGPAADPYSLGSRGMPVSYAPRPHSSMSGKLGTRSWHPSPFGSDDETDQEHHFFKEEKKNRIKMEISRRRHQIEENARLHEELIRLAKLRENAELGTMDYNSHRLGVAGYPSPSLSPGREGQSVLRSVDEILRTEPGAPHHYGLPNSSLHRAPGRIGTGREYGMSVARLGAAHHLEDVHDPIGTIGNHTRNPPAFNSDRYTSSVYDRVTDFSPVNSDYSNEFSHNPPMTILPDMASRSRKLMEDMNSTSYQANDKYASRSNYGYR